MNRIDFLGVPGVGKTTTYNLLGQTRQSSNEFLLFKEAYDLALTSQLPSHLRLVNKVQRTLGNNKLVQPFCKPLRNLVNHELSKAKRRFENEKPFEQIAEIWREYPDMLFLRLDGAGKQVLPEQNTSPSEYINILLKTSLRMKQFVLLDQSLPKKTTVVMEKSFTQMVFFNSDFSKKIDPDIIARYIKGIPRPAGVIIFNASQQEIVTRLRQRAKMGWVSSFHRAIIDTDLLDEWVNKACEIVGLARSVLLELGVNVFVLNSEEEPGILANNIREFVLGYRQ